MANTTRIEVINGRPVEVQVVNLDTNSLKSNKDIERAKHYDREMRSNKPVADWL